MSEQPNQAAENALTPVLSGAKYLAIAQAELGIPELLPDAVGDRLPTVEPPDNITWNGSPIWRTAYYAGLRQYVLRRREQPADDQQVAEQERRMSALGRRVSLANAIVMADADTLPSTAWADQQGPRFSFQQRYRGVLRWAAVSPPSSGEALPAGENQLLPDTIVIPAPTAVGKTLLGGDYLATAGVGTSDDTGRRRRGLWVTINQQLVRDLLNPDKTLRRCLPEATSVTAIWEGNKDEAAASGDVVAVTMQSLEDALEASPDGEALINPADFDTLIFDEGHEALSPRMRRLLAKFDCQKVLLTATPARGNWRSLLRQYHHTTPLGRREAIEEGLLSPVRIVSLMAESDMHAEHQAALAAIDFFIARGRKAVVYCQPGDDNGQARRIASLVQVYAAQILGDRYDEKLVYAEMVGSANEDSPESIAAFEAQEHGGIRTTCQMLGVGWDHPELDGGIWVGPQSDLLALIQESGRSARPKADGRPATWIQIHTPVAAGSQRTLYTLPQTVGLEEFPSPYEVIGASPPAPRQPQPPHPAEPAPEPQSSPFAVRFSSGQTPEGATAGEAWPRPPADAPPAPDGEDPLLGVSPELVSALIAPNTPIAEIIIEPDRRDRYIPPPEFSAVDEDLARTHNVPLSYVHYHLEPREGVPDVPYKLIRSLQLPVESGPDVRGYRRHYDAEAVGRRLATHPFPAVGVGVFGVAAMAKLLHAPESAIQDAITGLKLPARPASRAPASAGQRGGRPVSRYTLTEFSNISAWIERTPLADPGDEPWYQVQGDYPLGAKVLDPAADRFSRRHPPTSDRMGTDFFVTAETVRRVAAEEVRRRSLIPLREAALRAGVEVQVLKRALNATEQAFVDAPENRFAPPGGTKNSGHLTLAMVEDLARRIGPEGLRFNEITYGAIRQRVPASISETRLRAAVWGRILGPLRRIEAFGLPVGVYPMEILRDLELEFGLEPAEPVDYDRLLAETAASDPETVAYGRRVQTAVLGISPLRLAPDHPPEPEHPPAEAPPAEPLPPPQPPDPEPDPGPPAQPTVSLDDVAVVAGRSMAGVHGAIRQLNVAGEVKDGRITESAALAVLDLLAGGKKAPVPAAEQTAPDAETADAAVAQPVSAPPAATAAAGAAAATIESVTKEGRSAAEMARQWKCSGAALTRLVDQDPFRNRDVTQRESDGAAMLSEEIIARIAARIKKVQPTREDWVRHEMLARQVGVAPQELAAYLHRHGLWPSESEVRVVRLYGRADLELDTAYAPRIWRRAIAYAQR